VEYGKVAVTVTSVRASPETVTELWTAVTVTLAVLIFMLALLKESRTTY